MSTPKKTKLDGESAAPFSGEQAPAPAGRGASVVKLDGATGSTFELVCGDRSLVVKIADDAIIPDFVESATRAIKARPYQFSLAASRVFHREPEAETRLRDVLGDARDFVFSEIKVAEKPAEKPGESEE